jgi:hypothetical protein
LKASSNGGRRAWFLLKGVRPNTGWPSGNER